MPKHCVRDSIVYVFCLLARVHVWQRSWRAQKHPRPESVLIIFYANRVMDSFGSRFCFPHWHNNKNPAVQTFLRGAVSPMSEVLSGDFDLRVPVVAAVIDSYTQLSLSDVVVELVVSCARELGTDLWQFLARFGVSSLCFSPCSCSWSSVCGVLWLWSSFVSEAWMCRGFQGACCRPDMNVGRTA